MAQSSTTWSELSERLDALALKLKLHAEQAGSGAMPDAFTKLHDAVKGAFDAAGNAVRDEAVRADVREIGNLLANAVSTKFANVSDEVKQKLDGKS